MTDGSSGVYHESLVPSVERLWDGNVDGGEYRYRASSCQSRSFSARTGSLGFESIPASSTRHWQPKRQPVIQSQNESEDSPDTLIRSLS